MNENDRSAASGVEADQVRDATNSAELEANISLLEAAARLAGDLVRSLADAAAAAPYDSGEIWLLNERAQDLASHLSDTLDSRRRDLESPQPVLLDLSRQREVE